MLRLFIAGYRLVKTELNSKVHMKALVPMSGIQLALRASVAAGLSLAIAKFLQLQFPIYALIAAIIVTDLSPAESIRLGWRRLVATVIGAVCGATLSMVLPASSWSIALSILVAMISCHLLRTPEVVRVAGYTSAIVAFSYGVDPWHYAFYRLIETGLGICVAWAISYVPKLVRTKTSDRH
jgi:uncharacterized membrane protein YgaE (UPF0421/DUF939 family)